MIVGRGRRGGGGRTGEGKKVFFDLVTEFNNLRIVNIKNNFVRHTLVCFYDLFLLFQNMNIMHLN